MKNNVYLVSQVNNYLKLLLQDDFLLSKIHIKGEISNLKEYSSGHLFFSLKDENSLLNCVMYYENAKNLNFKIENGDEVTCFGNISLYEKSGQYQLCVKEIESCGKGNLYLEFERLKKKLDELDLFNCKFKKEIPSNPSCVAVITSPSGAVIHDILNVSSRRNPNVKIVLVPVLVQGDEAKYEIVQAIENVNTWNKADTIILARGGGSIEDLWAFNEEEVAKAIFNSNIPIISAIGHEVDFTISDFVADFRASTPSVAAEIAIPEVTNLKKIIEQKCFELNTIMQSKILQDKFKLKHLINKAEFKTLPNKLELYKSTIKNITDNFNTSINSKVKENKFILKNSIENLENKSPINILKKGYSLIYDENNNIINSKEDIKENDIMNINFYDGSIKAKVIEKG